MATSIAEARNALKKMKDVSKSSRKVFRPSEQWPHISTGSDIINHLIGGTIIPEINLPICPGIPRGRITEIYGGESSGKTTLGLSVAITAQREGGSVGFLDFENALSDSYAQALGLNYDEDYLDIWAPESLQEGLQIIDTWVENNVDLIIVDSISAMVPRQTLEGSVGDTEQIGLRARLISQYMGRLVNSLRDKKTAIILLNQVRSRIKKSQWDTGPDEDTSGGKAIKFYASIRLKLDRKRVDRIDTKDQITGLSIKKPYGTYTKVTGVKNKMDARQGEEGEIFIRYGRGIDNYRTIIDVAESRHIIKKGGSWFEYVNREDSSVEFKLQGKEQIQKLFNENPKTYNAVLKNVLDSISGPTVVSEEEGTIISEEISDDEPSKSNASEIDGDFIEEVISPSKEADA